ncbi:hypothetical protein BBK36DRAFT_1192853 [Trichoderma citrinoviride]|uniref:Uncharacterized protein n=1 Tax=Trichoderma citrinoviride TaxID=58853 RepID=A0A2T4BIC9_9HYPO|nr:hypothetical protein BBK36DRAFT_1192853 [Trichoderma citrinoviride]PTB69031.1 hypothetical protein BBK36DRAFT_1192853 [Trichoderma citrinoviride]
MPITPQEHLEWWLTTGLDALKELVDKETVGCSPQHVGFEGIIQRRQRGFDNDAKLLEALRQYADRLASHQAPDVSCNPRNKLRELSLNTFKKLEDGGLDLDRVLEGLADLNVVELRRRRLVADTPLTFKPNHPAYPSAAMIQELNKKATEKFATFYMGFRASAVTLEMQHSEATRKPPVEIMAVVNALFPAQDLLKNSEDVSLAPYTNSLLDCIRFAILVHLLGDNPSGEKQQAFIQEKLFIWCGLPRYEAAYKAFTQYIEEFKAIETLCFNVLKLAEAPTSRRKSASRRPSFTPNSVVMVKSILRGSPQSPREVAELAGSQRPLSPEFVASAPPVPNPLLKGLPGREYDAGDETVVKGERVAAKTFDPARKLKKTPPLPTKQKLLPPKQKALSTRQRLLQTRQRRSKRVDEDIPPVPPTPEIPMSMRSTITRNGLKLLERMRSHPELQSGEPSSSKVSQLATVLAGDKARSSAKLVKQPAHLPLRPPTRPKASNAQLRDSFSLRTSSLPEGVRNNQQNLYSQRASSTQSVDRPTTTRRPESYDGQEHGRRSSLPKVDVKYSMREPRLSNMEYARLYFVEEANAKKEKRECELPPPKKAWLWGQHWENFLVLPKIPSTIRRRFSLGNNEDSKKTLNLAARDKGHESDADSVETVKGTMSVPAKPPRLSLNFDTMASGLTTMMDVSSSGFHQASQVPARTKLQDEVVLSLSDQNPAQDPAPGVDVKEKNFSTVDNVQTLPFASTVSSISTNEREDEDLYSDDRHLWPSPMSQREARRVSVPLMAEEPTTAVTEDNQSAENTAPQLSEDAVETSSVYSNESSKTAVFVGDDTKSTGDAPQTPARPRRPAQLTTPGDESPVRPGIPFSYSCASFNSLSSDRSPLTHFPIAVEQRSRATTEDMVQGILTQSGGRLRVEDARQVQVVESKHDAELQASSADIWHTDGYMEPELQPAPLNLSKNPSTATKPRKSPSNKPARAKSNHKAAGNIQPSKNTPKPTPKPTNPVKDTAPPQYNERIKSYESGFVPLPGSLLYEADKNTDIIRIPRSLSSSSNSSSSVSAIITPSKPGPAKGTGYPAERPERLTHGPRPAHSMNQMYDAVAASNISQLQYESQPQPQAQTGKHSPTLSDLDEFFGVGPYEKAFLEKHPEAAKPFVLPPKVLETAESPVFTTPMLRRRDMSIQQHRELPQHTAERVMERKPITSTNVSSFALHRAQGNKATILPVIEGRSRANTTTARERDTGSKQDHDYEDSISEEHVPQHTYLEDVHRFSLQRYDISTRRPSTAHARPSTFFDRPVPLPPAEIVASERKIANTPATTLGSLFRRRNRNRTETQQPQTPQLPQPPQSQPRLQPRPQPAFQTPQQPPITPTILTTPRISVHQPIGQWQPFREERSPFTGASTRTSGDEESPYERQRIKFFREQTARALTGEIEPPRPPARPMGAGPPWATVGFEAGRKAHGQRTMNNGTWASDGRRGATDTRGRQISNPVTRTGATNDWVNQGLPSPAPTTPLPPVPPRPSGSGRQIPGTRSASRPSASAAAPAAPAGTLTGAVTGVGHAPAQPGQGGQAPSHSRNRNPLGLRVETTAWKLRKASKEALRSGRNVSGQHDGGSK